MDEWIYLVAALAAGFLLGVLVILPFVIRARRKRASHGDGENDAASAAPDDAVPLEIIDDALPDHDDHPFSVVSSRPPMRGVDRPAAPLPESAIPMEWAQRYEGGPAPEGRVRGACSGCGSKLTVSNRKPLRIACPVCGRTRLLT